MFKTDLILCFELWLLEIKNFLVIWILEFGFSRPAGESGRGAFFLH